MLVNTHSTQKGVTLIELLIGMVVGLIVLSGVIYVFITSVSSSRDILNSSRLNQDLSAIMSIISGDLRRAGHWIETASNASSPFTDIGMDIHVVSSSCVLYSYDTDADGDVDGSDYSGLRLSSGAVWIRTSGTSMTDCSAGSWERLSDQNFMTIDVANSSFVDSSKCLINGAASTACPSATGTDEVAQVREIQITLSANVNSDNDWQKTVQESVKIRNDFYHE